MRNQQLKNQICIKGNFIIKFFVTLIRRKNGENSNENYLCPLYRTLSVKIIICFRKFKNFEIIFKIIKKNHLIIGFL